MKQAQQGLSCINHRDIIINHKNFTNVIIFPTFLECVAMPFSNMHMIIHAKNKLFSKDMQARLEFLLSACASVWIFFIIYLYFKNIKVQTSFFSKSKTNFKRLGSIIIDLTIGWEPESLFKSVTLIHNVLFGKSLSFLNS